MPVKIIKVAEGLFLLQYDDTIGLEVRPKDGPFGALLLDEIRGNVTRSAFIKWAKERLDGSK